jgi:predicted dehydrogenase
MQKAGMTPVAVAEVDEVRRRAAAQDFPAMETYPSVGLMLRKSRVDLVAIITPHNTHARLALQCLRAGRHVVCEKPFAVTTAECDAMLAEARKRRLVLSTYHNRHWDGCILEAVRQLRAGTIGDVVRVEARMGGYGKPGDWWRGSKSISGGILYDWGVHLLEYALQIVNSEIVEVMGFTHAGFWASQTKWKADTIEDEGFCVVRFRNGVCLTLRISQLESLPEPGVVKFTGTQGAYVMGHGEYEVVTHEGSRRISTRGPNPQNEGWRFYANIAACMTRGEKLVITPEWARRPIHIIDLACQSAKRGVALRAKYA